MNQGRRVRDGPERTLTPEGHCHNCRHVDRHSKDDEQEAPTSAWCVQHIHGAASLLNFGQTLPTSYRAQACHKVDRVEVSSRDCAKELKHFNATAQGHKRSPKAENLGLTLMTCPDCANILSSPSTFKFTATSMTSTLVGSLKSPLRPRPAGHAMPAIMSFG
jgi:hypothetical protein